MNRFQNINNIINPPALHLKCLSRFVNGYGGYEPWLFFFEFVVSEHKVYAEDSEGFVFAFVGSVWVELVAVDCCRGW